MLLEFLVLFWSAPFKPEVLTVPIVYAQEIDTKSAYIEKLIDCESQNRPEIKILDTDGYYSYGAGQFHLATWLSFGKAFGATKENIYDGNLQRVVIRDMLDKGLWRHWYNCGKKLGEYK